MFAFLDQDEVSMFYSDVLVLILMFLKYRLNWHIPQILMINFHCFELWLDDLTQYIQLHYITLRLGYTNLTVNVSTDSEC